MDPTGLVGEAEADVELEGGVLVVKRIRVRYRGLQYTPEQQAVVARALAFHDEACPISRSIKAAIPITTSLA